MFVETDREPELDKELGKTDHGVSSKSYGRSRLDGNRQEHFDPGIDITAKVQLCLSCLNVL